MKDELRIILQTEHPDSVSGTSIMSDGSKIFWTEGRGEHTYIYHASGELEYTAAHLPTHRDHKHMNAIDKHQAEGDYPSRPMTLVEEHEWNVMRNEGKI